jgi:hypothetical protein
MRAGKAEDDRHARPVNAARAKRILRNDLMRAIAEAIAFSFEAWAGRAA